MKIRTFTWLAALTLLSGTALSAQTAGESQTPAAQPATLEEAEVPAPAEVQATATTEVTVPTPEAGAVQIQAVSEVVAEPKPDSDADPVIIEHESAETAPMAADVAGPAEDEMPKTASPLALLGLLGLGSSGTALGVRIARRRK